MAPYSLILVIVQGICLFYLAFTDLIAHTVLGIVIQVAGISVAIWGILAMRIGNFNIQPEVRATMLVESGPYQWIRNPMYLGILMICTPSVIDAFSMERFFVLLLLALILILKIYKEEALLLEAFSDTYRKYMKRTKRILPFIF